MTTLDETSFADIWRQHAPQIETWLRARVGDIAEDLTQDVFLAAWRRRDQYNPERGPVIGWLHGIATNTVADHWRATGRRPSTVDSEVERADDTRDPADTATDRTALTQAMAALPKQQRAVVAHRYLADRSVAETVQALGMATGTVKSTCARALKALAVAFGVITPVAPRPKRPVLADATPALASPAPRSAHASPTPVPDRVADRFVGRAASGPARHVRVPGVAVPPRGAADRPDPHRLRPGHVARRHRRRAGTSPGAGAPAAPVPCRVAGPPVPVVAAHPTPFHVRTQEGVCLMFARSPLPHWLLYGGIAVFFIGLTSFVLLLLTQTAPVDWSAVRMRLLAFRFALRHLVRRGGKHRRRTVQVTAVRVARSFTAGRSSLATQTTLMGRVEMPTELVFVPAFLPDEPVGDGTADGEPEPDPLPEEPVDPDVLAALEEQFHCGWTLTDPRFAVLLRGAYCKAAEAKRAETSGAGAR